MPADKLVADSAGRPARLQLLFFTLSDGDGMRWREIHVLYIYNITFTIVIDIISVKLYIHVRYRHDTVPTNHNSISHQRIADFAQEGDVEADRKRGEARKGRAMKRPWSFSRKKWILMIL